MLHDETSVANGFYYFSRNFYMTDFRTSVNVYYCR